jgi:hypothetical protein
MDNGVTGFVVQNLDEAVQAVKRVATLSRTMCRQVFEQRFTAARMARDYLEIYRRLVAKKTVKSRKIPTVDGFRSRAITNGQPVRADPDVLGVGPA